MTKESLFCLQRKPLFQKRGKSDFFYIEKFAISLFRSIFATGNRCEAATLGFIFPMCLRFAFALASLLESKKGGIQTQSTHTSPVTNPTKDRKVGTCNHKTP